MSGGHRTSPRAEEQLILLSAGTAARREVSSLPFRELGTTLDWSLIADLLRARRLLPTLGPRVLELAGGSASIEFAAAVERALKDGRRQGALLSLQAERIMAALAVANIRSAALKGPTLSEYLYGDPGRRLARDIDILVAPEQLHAAVEVVRGLGYSAPTDYAERHGLPLLHFVLRHQREELPPVELHWRVHWYEQSFARERLLPSTVNDPPGVWRPVPIDELAALLIFYARDGFVDLRHATDIGTWWDALGSEVEPGALQEVMSTYTQLADTLRVSAAVAQATVGLPLDRITGRAPKLGARGRLAVTLANPYLRSSEAQLYADMGLIDGLLTPRGEFRAFVRRQVLPPREVLDERSRHTRGRQARTPLGHGVRVIGRYVLAMLRLCHPRRVSRTIRIRSRASFVV
jgi:hypothetical protein